MLSFPCSSMSDASSDFASSLSKKSFTEFRAREILSYVEECRVVMFSSPRSERVWNLLSSLQLKYSMKFLKDPVIKNARKCQSAFVRYALKKTCQSLGLNLVDIKCNFLTNIMCHSIQ